MDKVSLTQVVLTSTFLSFFSAGSFGSFGAIVQYLYLVVKGQHTYHIVGLIQYAVMGFFVGMVVHEMLLWFTGENVPGAVLISGFIFMKILDFFNTSKLSDIIKIFSK